VYANKTSIYVNEFFYIPPVYLAQRGMKGQLFAQGLFDQETCGEMAGGIADDANSHNFFTNCALDLTLCAYCENYPRCRCWRMASYLDCPLFP
jgi:hypothetical protein